MTKADLLAACARGILFSTPMVRELPSHGGAKGRTMRVARCPVGNAAAKMICVMGHIECDECKIFRDIPCTFRPKHRVGDILYVRETWFPEPYPDFHYIYKADTPDYLKKCEPGGRWRPSLFMPKEAARTFLRVTRVKAQRPQELTDFEITAEGIPVPFIANPREYDAPERLRMSHERRWQQLWNSLRTKKELPLYGYDANPLCWVYEFREEVPDDKL